MNERESVLDSLSLSIINEGILGIRPVAGNSAGSKVIFTLVMKFRVFMCRFLNDRGVRCLFVKPQGGFLYFTLFIIFYLSFLSVAEIAVA